MIRRNRGSNAKVEAKKDKVKSRLYPKGIALLAVVTVALLFLGFTQNAEGEGSPSEVGPVVQLKIDKRHELALKHKDSAHLWRHKRGASHRYHGKMSPKTDSLRTETKRMNIWRVRSQNERKAFNKQRLLARLDTKKCTAAGFPRYLCDEVIRGAQLERKKSWAFDPNLAWIVKHESGFRPCVRNGGTIDCNYQGNRAYGLFQFLGSTWAGVRCTQTSDATWQVRCGIRYIAGRYHTPAGAVRFWKANRWY